jgi:hypothetical protein
VNSKQPAKETKAMSESIINNTVSTPRFRQAFESHLDEIRALPDTEFVPITIDIQSSVATVLGALKEIRPLRSELVHHLPTFDMAVFDNLESRTLALGHAQTNYQTATEPPASIEAQADTAAKFRDVLVHDVNTLILRGALESNVLKELRGANGYKNTAFDLFALSNVYKKHWNRVESMTAIKLSELDQAENLADQWVTAVGEREQAPAIAAQAIRDRLAAFTLFWRTYEEVRAAIGFLRRKQGDADSIAPSLYLGRNNKKKAEPATTEAADAPPTADAPDAPTGTTTQTTAASTATAQGIVDNGPFMGS